MFLRSGGVGIASQHARITMMNCMASFFDGSIRLASLTCLWPWCGLPGTLSWLPFHRRRSAHFLCRCLSTASACHKICHCQVSWTRILGPIDNLRVLRIPICHSHSWCARWDVSTSKRHHIISNHKVIYTTSLLLIIMRPSILYFIYPTKRNLDVDNSSSLISGFRVDNGLKLTISLHNAFHRLLLSVLLKKRQHIQQKLMPALFFVWLYHWESHHPYRQSLTRVWRGGSFRFPNSRSYTLSRQSQSGSIQVNVW